MSEVLQTNVFFIITSIAVVVITVMIGIALYYIIRILRAVRDVAERVRHGSELLAEDAATFRRDVLTGNLFSKIFSHIRTMAGMRKTRTTRPPRSRTTERRKDEMEGDLDTNE